MTKPKKSNWKGKLGGSHQTVIEGAWKFLPAMIEDDSIDKITLGYISGGKSVTGKGSVKIIDQRGCLLLSVRSSSANQEIRIFSKDTAKAKEVIVGAAKDANFRTSFLSMI